MVFQQPTETVPTLDVSVRTPQLVTRHEDHQQKLPGAKDETHESPVLESSGEKYSIGWPPYGVNRLKRTWDARS
jgi:hypothetical protein